MYFFFLGFLLLGCVNANNDAEYVNVKSVKGGHRGYHYNPTANYPNFYNGSRGQYGGYDMRYNMTNGYGSLNTTAIHRIDYEVGVCYIEVPTATLVRNPAQVPMGNGSRPDLSRIRSCCKGYIRNIHNSKICDPICSKECVNALCTAPETCSCFPDHVKNLAGFCIPICPIGCQNGHCSGGECLCKPGYKLDSESKYCIPTCRENCGGIGNCTDLNVCECKPGYQSTPEGNCRPVCSKCNGDCVAPNDCRCKPGYTLDQQGQCIPQCSQGCGPNSRCVSPNVCDQSGAFQPHQPGNFYPLYPGQQMNKTVPANNTYPGQIYIQNSTSFQERGDQLYTENQIYNGSIHSGFPEKPEFVPIPQRPGQPGYQPGQQRQPGQPGYPGYPGQSGPSGQPGYPGQSGPSGQPGYPGQSGPSGQPGYPGQYPGQPGYPAQFPGQSKYPGQYPGQPGYPGQYEDPRQYEFPRQPGPFLYPDQPGYRPGYPGPSRPGPHENPRQSEYPDLPGYRLPSGYPTTADQRHPNNQNQSSYPGNQGNQSSSTQPAYQGQPDHNAPSGINGQSPYPSYPPSNGLSGYGQQTNTGNDQCDQPCINGVCREGFCRCKPGYIMDLNDVTQSRCLPNCPGGCPNGVCSAPHFCICNPGYYKDTSVKGRQNCVKRIRRSISELLD